MNSEIRTPREHRLPVNGLDLAAWEWEGKGAPILLVHATGFHARCWSAVVRRLPGRHVFALDMPSHGASARKKAPYDWTHFGEDLAGAIAALDLQHLVGVGHSMGGHAMVLAAAAMPQRFRGLLLLDPVISEAAFAAQFEAEWKNRAAEHPVARRRNQWNSPAQMRELFAKREPYARWDPEVLRDYCEYGLVPTADGQGFELACPPDLEAEIYCGMHMRDIYQAIPKVDVPVEIVRARSRQPGDSAFDYSLSPTWPELAAQFSQATDEHLTDRSHFIPMELPEWTAERIATLADSLRPL